MNLLRCLLGKMRQNFTVLKMNAVSADILKALKEDTDPAKVHKYLKEKYPESTDDEIGNVLAPFLNKLLAEGLLID